MKAWSDHTVNQCPLALLEECRSQMWKLWNSCEGPLAEPQKGDSKGRRGKNVLRFVGIRAHGTDWLRHPPASFAQRTAWQAAVPVSQHLLFGRSAIWHHEDYWPQSHLKIHPQLTHTGQQIWLHPCNVSSPLLPSVIPNPPASSTYFKNLTREIIEAKTDAP